MTKATPIDFLVGQNLILGETIASSFRDKAARQIVNDWKSSVPVGTIMQDLVSLGLDLMPTFAEQFIRGDIAAWLAAFNFNYNRMPKWLQDHVAERTRTIGDKPPDTPWFLIPAAPLEPPRRVKFPLIDKAAASLMKRGILTRPEFDKAASTVQRQAFTVAGKLLAGTISQIRDILVEQTVTGPTLKEFRDTVQNRLNTGLLGPAHVENVYRTNLHSAYRDGRESLVSNPIVSEVFPYQLYTPIHDARARPEHRDLGKLGLNGTGVYRRDDPFWDLFTPPWDYQCRCDVTLLTLEQAANLGVREAKEWLRTGRPPRQPEWRLEHIDFRPKPGWGHRQGVAA